MNTTLLKLWEYNSWANGLVINSFEMQEGKIPDVCMNLFSHITNVQYNWVNRINSDPLFIDTWTGQTLEHCKRILINTSSEIKKHLDLAGQNQTQLIKYTSRGVAFENSLEDILMQTLNHATYHRGQIAWEMRKHHLEPVGTDYISFVRSKL